MYSDRFKDCARPSVVETETIRGQKVTFPKTWDRYTLEEKAACINYRFGAGTELILMFLTIEKENEELKTRIAALEPAR